MSEYEDERLIGEYRARRRALGERLTEADELEPPAALDRIVLNNAREAIRVSIPPAPFRAARWALPSALAATVVISFAVLLHLGLLPRQAGEADDSIEAHFHPGNQADTPAPAADLATTPETAARASAAPREERAAPQAEAGNRNGAMAMAEDPALWLKRIQKLRAQGRTAEAERELQVFRRAWPDYAVPEASR